ncbi:acyl-CoA dehydrogenase family protein [Streptomyces sp. NBC_01477]|uniref:acyl-CoA dehydrogenase family protein n=1 Tax=Streptomyces sp. NBC_01477 TaxID=2976015 RepID=UPI002E3608A7|nr:acyl-CoA dehydrogenase family protein [Streptomyces sp. NBC_01477]
MSDSPPVDYGLRAVSKEGHRAVDLALDCLPTVSAGAADHDRAGSYARESHDCLARAGLMGATVPRHLGGLGVRSLRDVAAVLERIGAADASVALALHMQLSRGLSLSAGLLAAVPGGPAPADQEGPSALLRSMADGSAFVAGAVTEAGASYFTVHSTVSRTPEGAWALTGDKLMVTGAPAATHFAVRARVMTDAGPRLGGVIVRRADRGVSVGSGWDGLGMRGSGSERVRFAATPVLPWSLSVRGEWGRYDPLALPGRLRSSAGMLGIYLGLATAARHEIAGALARRQTAGDPGRWSGPLVQAELEAAAARQSTAAFLSSVDESGGIGPDDSLALSREWQLCRLQLHKSMLSLSDLAMSTVGAGAYRWASPVSRILRDCRAAQFMQPYGPAQAERFIASSHSGHDPEFLV